MPADLTREEIRYWRDFIVNLDPPDAADVLLRAMDAALYSLGEPARLASAKAEGVREGIEMAAQWHDEQAAAIHSVTSPSWNNSTIARHLVAAEAIRALSPPPAEPAGMPAEAPGHTDLMVTPESLDAFLAENQPQAEPSAPVAPEGEAEATRYLERLIENAAPPPTRPLYGDLIGLCTQVDSLLCYVREQGKERAAALEAENAKLRERNAALEDGLKPFAAAAGHALDAFGVGKSVTLAVLDRVAAYFVDWTHYRRARALLQGDPK